MVVPILALDFAGKIKYNIIYKYGFELESIWIERSGAVKKNPKKPDRALWRGESE